MGFGIRSAYKLALATVRAHSRIAPGIEALLQEHRRQYPEYDWDAIAGLDYAGDASALCRWLTGVLTDEPPELSVSGFWFGLFDPIYDRRATRGFYVAGSERFDPAVADEEWPVGPEYFPESRYVRSSVLEALYRASDEGHAAHKDASSSLNYTWCLTYAGLWVRQAMQTLDRDLLLGGRDYRGVGFGFDSGDLTTLGILRPTGFELLDE